MILIFGGWGCYLHSIMAALCLCEWTGPVMALAFAERAAYTMFRAAVAAKIALRAESKSNVLTVPMYKHGYCREKRK